MRTKAPISYQATSFFLLISAALVLPGCGGPDPEVAGDECDPDDGCPNGMVCEPGGDDHICYVTPGGTCDAAGPDYCQGDSTCSEGVCTIGEGAACDPANSHCAADLVCAELSAGGHACFPPVVLTGMVFDSTTTGAIEGAHVIALDAQATAVTDVAVSDVEGRYSLDIPVSRGADGAPVGDRIFTLRASASDYQTFPGGIRTSLPIPSSEATAAEAGWTIESALTDIALIPLPEDEQGLPSVSGSVVADKGFAGVLVVAEDGSSETRTAISDLSGAYTIFNVPAGSHTVRGYAAGLQLEPASANVDGASLEGVDLLQSSAALGSISGSINIVNAPGGSATSVVLVVASTFNDTFVRGEVPPGLRSPLTGPPDVNGAFDIQGVPEGDYVVLAAFENDDLVRDPDPNIAGTQIVTVSMTSPGDEVSLSDSFKITEALAVVGPGVDEPEPVSAPLTLRWADDSSEDFYTVVVYDAYGELAWCLSDEMAGCDGPNVPSVSGGDDVSVEYGGPLEPGMYYQFRATSWRQSGQGEPGAISTTEDLRGVFFSPQ